MIKFFKKIRQQLLTENKLSKYLIYAIGKIVLVITGILLVLQVNNRNKNRKERLTQGLQFDLKLDAIKNKRLIINYYI